MRLRPGLAGISALDDQAAAGAIMWVPGSVAFLLPVVMLVARALSTQRPSPHPPRVLHRHRPKRGLDLLQVPIVGPILRYRHFRRVLQVGNVPARRGGGG